METAQLRKLNISQITSIEPRYMETKKRKTRKIINNFTELTIILLNLYNNMMKT